VASFRSARRRDDDTVRFPLVLFLVSLGLALGALYVDRPAERPDALAQFRADATNDAASGFPVHRQSRCAGWRMSARGGGVSSSWRKRTASCEIQIAELRAWRDVARSLQETNARYRDALNLQGPVSGRAHHRLDRRGSIFRLRALAPDRRRTAAGRRAGLSGGECLRLIGRTVEVGERSTRVILLTDFNSRIAVMADRSNARALLVGDNSEFPRLDYLGRDPDLQPGDRIVTSGDDNVMPRGLPVGEAVLDRDGRWRVALYSRAAPVDLVWIWPFQPVAPPEADPVAGSKPNCPLKGRRCASDGALAAGEPQAESPRPKRGRGVMRAPYERSSPWWALAAFCSALWRPCWFKARRRVCWADPGSSPIWC
jgi:rod shape-determining protein MreC